MAFGQPYVPVTDLRGCTVVNIATPDGRTSGAALLIKPGSGMGYNSQALSDQYAIRISDSIDYEISFWLKQDVVDPSLQLSVDTFNSDYIQTYTYDIKTTLFEKNFLPAAPNKIISIPNQWYFVRHILYAYDQPSYLGQQPLTSLGVGTNLVMGQLTRNMFLTIKNINPSNNIYIWKLQVKPLRTPFSTGFIQSGNLLEIWRKNNNKVLSNDQVDKIAQEVLLPYNTGQSVINL